MTAEELHQQLVAAGFTLRADGGLLRVSPAARVGQRLQKLIRQHKAALLVLVNQPPALTADEQADSVEASEERAAIREFDGNEERATAEVQAANAMRVYRLLIAMGEGQGSQWVTLLAPGCDLAEVAGIAQRKFPGRVQMVRLANLK